MGSTIEHRNATPYEAMQIRYENALQTLCARVLAEPYNFYHVDGAIVPKMLSDGNINGRIIAQAQKDFRKSKQYTPQSIASALNISMDELFDKANADHEMDLPFAFEMFVEHYGRKVEMDIARQTEGLLWNGDTSEQIKIKSDQTRRESGLSARVMGSDGKDEFQAELIAAMEGKMIEYPIKPPIKNMRKIIPFHEPGEYVIVGGRTGMGKSFYGLNCIHAASLDGIPTCYINLENTPKNIQKRIWQMESGLEFRRDMSKMPDRDFQIAGEAWDRVRKMPFKSHHTGRSVNVILNTIRQDFYERGIQLAVIDYIQLMRDIQFKNNRPAEISEISAEVRALCLDLKIPLIALAQIGREAERSGDKRPGLSDLKGSGGLEEDAATVLLPFRPAYYEITQDGNGRIFEDDYADIHIAKGREVGTGLIECRFNHIKGFYDKPDESKFPTTAPVDFTLPASARPKADEKIPF
jgi:KaiC/GvpD/RAD55 family RecA-like ATPase